MIARRTCRACGCWELQACEGGCSWISADRCSACPDAPLTLPVNAAHLEVARFEVKVRYHWLAVDGTKMERIMLRCVEFPQVMIMATAHEGKEIGSEIYVGAMRVEADADPTDVANLLNPIATAA